MSAPENDGPSEKDRFDRDQWETTPIQDPRKYAQDQASARNAQEKAKAVERILSSPVKDWAATERKKMQDNTSAPPPAGTQARPATAREIVDRHARDLEQAIIGAPPTMPPDPLVQRTGPQRYRDAADFDEEVEAGDRLHGGDRRPLDDSVIITHLDSDRRYKLTVSEAIKRNLRQGDQRYKDRETNQVVNTSLTQPKVHVMSQGSTLCRFTSLRPVDWPKGHEWISLADAQRGVRFTCNECAKRIV